MVYAKRPFGGAAQVFSYLGRYTHRTGISNQRLLSMSDDGVCFRTKDGKRKTLFPVEFIHRFLLHVLPPGFVKIRHYGLLSSVNVKTKLQTARRLLDAAAPKEPSSPTAPSLSPPASPPPPALVPARSDSAAELLALERFRCPSCQLGFLVRSRLFPRSPHRRDCFEALRMQQPMDSS